MDALAERDAPTMPEGRGYRMRGEGATVVAIPREALWAIVMDETRLAAAIPGAETLHRVGDGEPRIYAADVPIGVGPVRGTYRVSAEFAETREPERMVLLGGALGPLGNSRGEGFVRFEPVSEDGVEGTRVVYAYAILITGMVARVGGKLLDAAADRLIAKFFARLAKAVDPDATGAADARARRSA